MRPALRTSPLARRTGALLALVAAACGGRDAATPAAGGDVGGTLVIASPGEVDILLPPLTASLQGAQITQQLFDRLAEIGDSLNTVGDAGFTPALAERWSWAPDSMSIRFAVNPRARWHDGAPVRAADVKFSFDVYKDPKTGSSVAPLLGNVDSVSTPDSLTAVVHFKARSPEQFFDAVYNVFILPQHLLGGVAHDALREAPFARQPVGTGRFRFARWVAGDRVEVVADTANWRGRPKLDRVVWTFAPDPGAATARVLAGEADVWELLRGEAMAQVAASPTLRAMPYPGLDIGFLAFNVTAAPFADRAVRRAIGASLDRASLVRSALDTLAYVANGPTPRALVGETPPPPAFDSAAAARTLDSLGWRVGADGVRARDGKPLAFGLLVPSTSATRARLAVLMQEQLKRLGVRVTIESVEPNLYMQRLGERRFDATLHGWHGDPSPATIRQLWSSAAATGSSNGGANVTGYASRTFDALLDSASAAMDPAAQRALYQRAYAVLTDDAPAVWLYELRNFAAVHRRLRPVGLRADAWWAHLADWSIPANERIDRDRIGLRTAR